MGAHVQNGVTVAVDPKVIPLGTSMQVTFKNGVMHRYQAQDVGAAIKGKRIDIYDSSYSRCITNGIETVWVKWDVAPNDGTHAPFSLKQDGLPNCEVDMVQS